MVARSSANFPFFVDVQDKMKEMKGTGLIFSLYGKRAIKMFSCENLLLPKTCLIIQVLL